MKQFKIMGETAKIPGRFYKFHNIATESGQTVPITKEDMDLFWKRYEDAKVFVFDVHSWPMPSGVAIKVVATDEPELDVPFQTCAFETLTIDGKNWLIELDSDKAGNKFTCILLHEIAPRQYDMYAMGGVTPKICYVPWEAGKGNPLAWLNIIWLTKLGESALGVEHVRERIRIGSGTEKRTHTIRQIIRVVSKSSRAAALPAFSREIDWSHRWAVRGHWRRHGGLGKNRSGEYCVEGFTWVSDFVKGPEGVPLVKKVRLVKQSVKETKEKC